jgi:hypothetical protein
MTEKPLAFLSLVKLLETIVGQKTGYTLLDPFPCVPLQNGNPAIVSIQNAGKIISQHIGLADLSFVISVTPHDPDIAGHIELNRDGTDVFVELSYDICQYKDARWARSWERNRSTDANAARAARAFRTPMRLSRYSIVSLISFRFPRVSDRPPMEYACCPDTMANSAAVKAS